MKPQGSTLNKPGSKYSPGPVLYNLVLFKTGATDTRIRIIIVGEMLHPFSRIWVVYNQNPIMHNWWEWVIYNRRKRVPKNFPPFLFLAPFLL
jgi:hypothetical protein